MKACLFIKIILYVLYDKKIHSEKSEILIGFGFCSRSLLSNSLDPS